MAEEIIEQRIIAGTMTRVHRNWIHEYADLCVDYDTTEQAFNLFDIIIYEKYREQGLAWSLTLSSWHRRLRQTASDARWIALNVPQ